MLVLMNVLVNQLAITDTPMEYFVLQISSV